MSSKSILKKKQKKWDEIFEEKQQLRDVVKVKPREDTQKFLLESKFQLMEDALSKTKYDSPEFNSILNDCVALFLEMNDSLKDLDKNEIIKKTKDRIFKDEIIGEFDGKKIEDPDKAWPKSGRITLRQAIDPKFLGRKKGEPELVTKVFAGDKKPDEYPSPSSSSQPKSKTEK